MVDQRLIEYIKTEEAQGFTEAQLRKALEGRGYRLSVIDDAIAHAAENNLHPALSPDAQPKKGKPETTPKEEKKPRKKHRPLGVILVMALFWLSGIAWLITAAGVFGGGARLATMTGSSVLGDYAGFSAAVFSLLGIIPLVIGILIIWVGVGLFQLKEWARGSAITLSIVFMVPIITIPIGLILVWLLVLGKDAFEK